MIEIVEVVMEGLEGEELVEELVVVRVRYGGGRCGIVG